MLKTINFSELYEADYNLCSLFAMRQHWKENSVFRMTTLRTTSCFLYFNGCSAEYTLPDGSVLEVDRGSVVYIPEGCTYETRFFGCDTSGHTTVLVEFSLCDADGRHFAAADGITVLSHETDPLRTQLFSETVDIYTATVVSPSALRSAVYRLLTEFSRRERRHSLRSREFGSIEKGITYLESETNGGEYKSVAEMAEMCHVSESTFRRLFKLYAGVSPQQFRINARMEYAQKLLQDGSMSVTEVAFATGFSDPAYFCRVFKRHTGLTPGGFQREIPE